MGAGPDPHPAIARCVGESPAIRCVLADLASVADTPCPVLLEGESGTGKELIARIINEIGFAGRGAFEAVNCGAIPEPLLESELFGHVAGAFTGATHPHVGVFERARDGTVFLDEIGEMPLQAQVKILRVLQEGTFMPLGGEALRHTRARVIAASNRDLKAAVKSGRFREDLFYRLNVFPIRIPPLRDRREDIPLLIDYFLERYATEMGRPRPRVDAIALRRLLLYAYPGNVRELQNIVRVLLIESRGTGEIVDDHVVAVFSRHRLRHEPHAEEAGDEDDGPSEAEENGGGRTTAEIGAWVLAELRAVHFNVALAEKMLVARRLSGRNRQDVPVFSRSGLSYYLQGEAFRVLAEEKWNVAEAAHRLAGDAVLVPRVRRRLERIHAGALAALRRGGKSPARRLIALRKAFAKMPAAYHGELERLAGEFEGGRWG
jgi:transcriptional regulator with GAF, ATPase, and Fis domain